MTSSALLVGPRVPPSRYVQLVGHLVGRELRVRYQNAVLGWAWGLLPPAARLLVLGLVFTVVFPSGHPDYVAMLAVGLLSWTWFSASVSGVTRSAVDRPDLLSQPAVPRSVPPLTSVLADGFDYLAGLPVLLVVLLTVVGHVPATAVLLLPLLVLQACLALGLGLVAAVLDVRSRDARLAVDLVLAVGFYATPVFYVLDTVPEPAQHLLGLSPLARLIEAQRDVVVEGVLPPLVPTASAGAVCLLVLAAGWWLHARASRTFLDAL